jgi:hypothetical protein
MPSPPNRSPQNGFPGVVTQVSFFVDQQAIPRHNLMRVFVSICILWGSRNSFHILWGVFEPERSPHERFLGDPRWQHEGVNPHLDQ